MLKIETWDKNKILRTISKEIKQSEFKEYTKLWKEMVKYIKNPKHMGVWLAAPQVGHNKRLIVVSLMKHWDDENFPTIMMLNPTITEFSENSEIDVEGCLSVPGGKGKVRRPVSITMKYIDEKGKEKKLHLDGLPARIVQHEVDHLNGVLFTDRMNETLLDGQEEENYAN